MVSPILVISTFPSFDEAKKAAKVLVEEKWAACAQIGPPITSFYVWKGKFESSEEVVLTLKSIGEIYDGLERRLKMLHRYETPEIVSIPISAVEPFYLQWMKEHLNLFPERMLMHLPYPLFKEQSAETAIDLSRAHKLEYGRVLEDLDEGEVFCHPRGLTIDRAFAIEFATTFMETNPLYLNAEYAKAHGFRDLVVSPLLVMNVALSLGVQNDSEKAIANLGYYNVCFAKSVYPGDTLCALTKVLKRETKDGKPGIATIRTLALNQHKEVVLQYDRKIMVAPAGKKTDPSTIAGQPFPELATLSIELPEQKNTYPKHLTGIRTYFEDFNVGDIFVHANGRTITDEHFSWTYRVMNTHPLHYDRLYSTGRSGAMSGEPIVYGGLVFAWLAGLASRDTTENALVDFGYTEGYHTQPAVSGDTVYAISRVLSKSDGPQGFHAGLIQLQLIGLKNIKSEEALAQFGADLFIKENDKKKLGKEKIPQKIFEIERRVLVKYR